MDDLRRRHEWVPSGKPWPRPWRCLHCNAERAIRMVRGKAGICHPPSLTLAFRPSYEALEAEVAALHAMLAEFA